MRSARNPSSRAGQSGPLPFGIFCPTCALPLVFRGTFNRTAGHGDPGAPWHQYECGTCGRFELRVRGRNSTPQPG